MAILKIKDKGVWKEIQAIKGDTGHDVYVGNKSKAPTEAKLIIEPVKGTATGTDIQVTNSVNDRVSKLVLDGRSTQETRSGKNLFKPKLGTTISNGITCTANRDGTYTLNGTATADVTFTIGADENLTVGKTYKFLGCPNGGSNTTYRMGWNYYGYDFGNGLTSKKTSETRNIQITVFNGITMSNLIFKPMLTEDISLTYYDYEQYGASPSPDYPSEIENVKGKNLFDKNKKAVLINAKKDILNTGVRATLTKSINWAYFYMEIGKKELLGKTISYGAEFFVSGQNRGRIALYFGSSTKEAIQIISYLEQTGTKTTTIPSNFPNGTDRIYIMVYASTRESGNIGDYVDYTNLMVVEGSMSNKYIPYGNIQIVETGKNLFDVSNSQIGVAWNLANNTSRAICNIKVNPNTTYFLSFESISGIDSMHFGQKINTTDTTTIGGMVQITANRQITTGINTNYLVIQFNKAKISMSDIEAIKLQLEKDSTATDCEPYTEEVVNIDLKGNELCSLPNGTKDELVVKDGRAKIGKEICEVVLDGSDDEIWGADTGGYLRFYKILNGSITTPGRYEILSNYFKFSNDTHEVGIGFVSSGVLFLYPKRDINTVDKFKTWLSTHNTIVQYELAEPYEIDLGEVSTLTTYEGTSNITNSEDTNMDIEYDTNKTNLYYQNNGNIIRMNEGS